MYIYIYQYECKCLIFNISIHHNEHVTIDTISIVAQYVLY